MLTNSELSRIKEQASNDDVIKLVLEVERLKQYIKDYSSTVTQKIDLIENQMTQLVAENTRLIAIRNSAYVERDACLGLISQLAMESGYTSGITTDNTIVVELPSGQVSWVIEKEEVHLFTHLPVYSGTIEEMTIEEKYRRVMNAGIAHSVQQ